MSCVGTWRWCLRWMTVKLSYRTTRTLEFVMELWTCMSLSKAVIIVFQDHPSFPFLFKASAASPFHEGHHACGNLHHQVKYWSLQSVGTSSSNHHEFDLHVNACHFGQQKPLLKTAVPGSYSRTSIQHSSLPLSFPQWYCTHACAYTHHRLFFKCTSWR